MSPTRSVEGLDANMKCSSKHIKLDQKIRKAKFHKELYDKIKARTQKLIWWISIRLV